MKHQEGFLKGVRGANIYFQNWLPEGDPKAVLLVIPGLAEHMKPYRLVKYRALRAMAELPILTRETFEEQIASDPVEQAQGQMMMF